MTTYPPPLRPPIARASIQERLTPRSPRPPTQGYIEPHSGIERAELNIGLDNVEKLADGFQIPVGELPDSE